MEKGKKRFERIPLREIQDRLASESRGNDRQKIAANIKNVQKLAARPKRNIRTEGEDHPVGLWIDKDIFRKHQNRPPQILLSDGFGLENRYLTLADLALANSKDKTKKRARA